MKKIITAGLGLLAVAAMPPANAADMPVKVPVHKEWSWSGHYIGVNIGYSWGRSQTDASYYSGTTGLLLFASSESFSMDGMIGGAQIGVNWQNGNFVWGLETDIQASGQKGSIGLLCPGAAAPGGAGICSNTTAIIGGPFAAPVTGNFDQKLGWFGTLRGRLGVAWSQVMMTYITGGLAYGQVETDATLRGFTAAGAPVGTFLSNTVIKVGWTVGVGAEARLAGNWTGKIEYLYMDLGQTWVAGQVTNAPPLFTTFSSHVTDNIVRVGLNYKFNDAIYAEY